MIYKYRWPALVMFCIGVIILLMPDGGTPVIRLNGIHGPSLFDIAGLSMMLIGWLVGTLLIIQSRRRLSHKPGKPILFSMMFIYIISIAGIIAGLNLSVEWILWSGVAGATLINILLVIAALRVSNK